MQHMLRAIVFNGLESSARLRFESSSATIAVSHSYVQLLRDFVQTRHFMIFACPNSNRAIDG